MDEKSVPRSNRFNAVGFCLAGIRVWQWSSSFFAYASFSLLYDHIQRNHLGETSRMKTVQVLGFVSLISSTLTIFAVHVLKTLGLRVWRSFAIASFPCDLCIMGICIAKITLLAYSGLPADCHGLTRDTYHGNDLMRQPADGYSTIRFGSWSLSMDGELDELCTFPRTVYGLSVVAIFSYSFSLLLTVLYVQQHPRTPSSVDREKGIVAVVPNSPRPTLRFVGDHFNHSRFSHESNPPSILDLDTSSRPQSPSRSSLYSTHHTSSRPSSPPNPSLHTTASSQTRVASASISSAQSWGAITLESDSSTDSDAGSFISGTSLPPRPLPGAPTSQRPRRWSTSTSSSFNANAFLVTDGFRPDQGQAAAASGSSSSDPPAYCSRPGSLYEESMKYPAGLGMPGIRKS